MILPVFLWALAAAAPGDVLVLDLKPIGVDGAEVQVVDAIVGEAVAEAFASARPLQPTRDNARFLIEARLARHVTSSIRGGEAVGLTAQEHRIWGRP